MSRSPLTSLGDLDEPVFFGFKAFVEGVCHGFAEPFAITLLPASISLVVFGDDFVVQSEFVCLVGSGMWVPECGAAEFPEFPWKLIQALDQFTGPEVGVIEHTCVGEVGSLGFGP